MITIGNVIEVSALINEATNKLSSIIGEPVILEMVSPEIPGVRYDRQLIENINNDYLKHTIVGVVCEQFMISIAALRGPAVYEPLPDARKIVTLLVTKYVRDIRLEDIAELINRDHSTINNQKSKGKELLESNTNFRFHYHQCLKHLKITIRND